MNEFLDIFLWVFGIMLCVDSAVILWTLFTYRE
jgi:hypothetical protein